MGTFLPTSTPPRVGVNYGEPSAALSLQEGATHSVNPAQWPPEPREAAAARTGAPWRPPALGRIQLASSPHPQQLLQPLGRLPWPPPMGFLSLLSAGRRGPHPPHPSRVLCHQPASPVLSLPSARSQQRAPYRAVLSSPCSPAKQWWGGSGQLFARQPLS